MATVMTIKCPDCGNELKVTVEETTPAKVKVTTKSEKEAKLENIATIIREGKADKVYKLGDTIGFNLKDGTYVEFEIASFSPYEENTLALVMKDCVVEDRAMTNSGAYCKEGWSKSSMREYLNKEFYDLLPDEFKSIIKKRTIKQKIGDEVIECDDNVWIPSLKEMTDDDSGADTDDVHFELYESEKSRIRAHEGDTWYWWLRSPNVGGTSGVYGVTSSGGAYINRADVKYGVAPACIIG